MPHVELLEARHLFAFGSLDTTFGPDGHVAPLPGIDYVPPKKTLVQSDGRILLAGGINRWELRRYLPDGSTDLAFGDGGIVRMTQLGFTGQVEFLAETVDGKIFVGGTAVIEEGETYTGDTAATMLIARLNFNGSLDETFLPGAASNVGHGGFMRVGALMGRTEFRKQLLKVDAAGKLLVATGEDAASVTLSRYKPNGQLDKSFGAGGRVTNVPLVIPTDPAAPPGKKSMTFRGAAGLSSLAIAPDGSIVGMGYYTYGRGTSWHTDFVRADIPYFVRFSVDGQVMSTFVHALDINKAQSSRYTGLQVRPSAMEVAPDGKIYVAGPQVLIRFNPDFTLDPTFSADGIITPSAVFNGTTFGANLADLKVQADGKAIGVVSDFGNSIDVSEGVLVRFNADGSTESSVQLAAPPNASPPVDLPTRTLSEIELTQDGTLLVSGTYFPITRVFRDEGPAGRFDGGSIRTGAQAARIYKFGIVWRDDDGVDLDTIDNGDLQILTPGGGRMIAQLISKTRQLDGSVVARYRTGPPDGVAWRTADNGQYIVRLLSNRVADVTGALAAGRTLGSFSVQVPTPVMTTSTTAVAMDLGRNRERVAPNT